jgi:hypothetical protein
MRANGTRSSPKKRQENQHLAVTPSSRNAQQTPARPGNPKRCAARGRKGSCQGVFSMGFLSRSPKSPRRRPKTVVAPPAHGPSRTRAHRHTGLLVCIQRSRTIGPVQTPPYQLHGAHPQHTRPPSNFKLPPPALAAGCARRGAGRARAGREQVLGCCRSCRRAPRRCRRPARPTPATASRAPMSAPGHAACSEQPTVFADMRAGRPRSSERAPTAETKGALSLRAPTVIIAPQCCLVQGPRPCECALSESPLLGPCQQPRTWFPPSRSAQHPQP